MKAQFLIVMLLIPMAMTHATGPGGPVNFLAWKDRTPLQIGTGNGFTCVLRPDSTVKCWGQGSKGQLGLGNTTSKLGDNAGEMGANLPTINLGTGVKAQSLAVGDEHACVITTTGAVKCWGRNDNGQLGLGDINHRGDAANEMGDSLPFVQLGTGRTAKAITAGWGQTCAILDNNGVKCWGRAAEGQLGIESTLARGDGTNEMGDNLPFVSLGTGRTAVKITAGTDHVCAILDNGKLKCWGANGTAQLGLGSTVDMGTSAGQMGDNLPEINLGTGRTVKSVSAGYFHTCAILDNDKVKCWGYAMQGEIGSGAKQTLGDNPAEMGDSLPEVPLGTGRTALAIRVFHASSCALLDNLQIKCWGDNLAGQSGSGDLVVRGDNAGEMGDALPVVNLGTGFVPLGFATGGVNSYHTCVISTINAIKCWGDNTLGELGLGDIDRRGDSPADMGLSLPRVQI